MAKNFGWRIWCWAAIAALGVGAVAAAEPTVFELMKEGNRYIGEQSKDKVVQVRSEKSVAGVTPNIWYVVYYDPTATFKAVEVKFGAGKMMDVKRPLRLLEPVTGGMREMNREKIKIDSDKALKSALEQPLLEKLTLKATQMKLENSASGDPVWRIKIWAAKLRKASEQVEIGEITLNAETGDTVKVDLHIDRVD